MEIQLNAEHRLVQETIRSYLESEIRPRVLEWDRAGRFPQEVVTRLGELGFLGMAIPEAYGGNEVDAIAQILVVEELARVIPSMAITVSVSSGLVASLVLEYGTEEQRQRYLPLLVRGQGLGAFALTEPDAGSDAGSIRTRAVRRGDRFILEGTKIWVTNAEKARFIIVQAVTRPEAGKRGISSLIVETDWPGVIIGRNEPKIGLHSSVTNPVTFESVEVPASQLLGEEGAGLRIALSGLNYGRIGVAAQAVGIAQGAYEAARAYATQRKTFGRYLAEHQAVAFKLADMAMAIEVARWLTYRAAWTKDQGRPLARIASMAKLYASEMCQKVTYEAVQIFGGFGYSLDYPVSMYARDGRVTTIYEGTSEIQRMVIARAILAEVAGG